MFKKILLVRLSPTVFDKATHPRNIHPPLISGYILSLLEKNGYAAKLIDCRIKKYKKDELIREITNWDPDFLIFSVLTSEYLQVIELSTILKKKKKLPIAVIGQHASHLPETLVYDGSPIDYCFLGECEFDILKFIKGKKNVKSLYSLKKKKAEITLIKDLDSLPFPKHELFDPEAYQYVYPLKINKKVKWGSILASRGCPYRCIFCSQYMRETYGNKFRIRNHKNVVDEIEHLLKFGANTISFLDDNFTTSKKYVISICNEILDRGLEFSWIAHARVEDLDETILHKMKDAGCVLLKIGVESGSQRIINLLKKTKKPDWTATVKSKFDILHKVGIPVIAMFLVGSPSETMEDVCATMNLASEIKPDLIQVAYFTPYPGSAAFELYKKDIKLEGLYHYKLDNFNVSRIPDKKLKNLLSYFYKKFYFNPSFIFSNIKQYIPYYTHNFNKLLYLIRYFLKK